jgi:hypothetical protein
MSHFVGANLTQTYTSAQLRNGNTPKLGDVYHAANGNVYRFVHYQGGAGSVAGVADKAVYIFATSAASTGATTEVTMDLTDALPNNLAGILMAAAADQEYCWIHTRGFHTLATTLTSGADGAALGPGGADGACSHVETTSSATATKVQNGQVVDASAKIVFLNCMM